MEWEPITLAYLAGAMDSDGYFSIKRSTYHMRVRKDASNPVYSEVMGLHQVTLDIPHLLRDYFGGTLYQAPPQTPNSKPLYRWRGSDLNAARAAAALLPYLRVKRRQAELLCELRESKKPGYGQAAYWFAQEFPNWRDMELLTTREVVALLGYQDAGSVSQAIANGSLLALPGNTGGNFTPRIPRLLVERLHELAGIDGRSRRLPPQLVDWRQRLWQETHELNKVGVNGTELYHQTGYHTPAV